MHRQHNTPLRVSVVAVFVALLMAFLFGGTTRADEESLQSAATQSANVATEAQSSDTVTTAATSDNEDQSSSGVATDSNCTPRPISAEEIQTDLKTQDGSMEYTAYEAVEFAISLTLFEGHCAGDGIVITVPSELGTDGSFDPIPMTTPDGVTIGVATYHPDRTVSISLTSEVENPSRKDFRASAWWRVHMSSSLVPGETRELQWSVNGVVRRTTIQVGVCDGCSTIGKDPSKWGSVDGGKQSITVVLPTAERDGQEFIVTDVLTSSGQQFNCDQLVAGRVGVYRSAGPWGQPMYDRFQDPTVVSCDSSKATIKVALNQGEKARLQLNVGVDPADPGPWTDTASIVSQDQSWEVTARIVRREAGGNAGFDTNPVVPTPTPTPTATPTPEPTPSTPSVTPEPTPSPSPSTTPEPSPSAPSPAPSPTPLAPTPSTTPSVTPTPSPSTTPTRRPVPLPTPVIERYKEPTPSAIPTPAPQRKLAVTGTDGSAIAGAVALLALGSFILWVRRRQTARSEG